MKPESSLATPEGMKKAERQILKQIEAAENILPKKEKGVIGTIWGWVECEYGKRYRYVKHKGVLKYVSKRVPGLGAIVTVASVSGDVDAKGVENGLVNSGCDAIPVVGTVKGIVEVIIADDLIPDK